MQVESLGSGESGKRRGKKDDSKKGDNAVIVVVSCVLVLNLFQKRMEELKKHLERMKFHIDKLEVSFTYLGFQFLFLLSIHFVYVGRLIHLILLSISLVRLLFLLLFLVLNNHFHNYGVISSITSCRAIFQYLNLMAYAILYNLCRKLQYNAKCKTYRKKIKIF